MAAVDISQASAVVPNPSWLQSMWKIDPQDVTGLADDSNTGLDALHPVRTWNGGVIAKYGTREPYLLQGTEWEFLSSHVDGSDPVDFSPRMIIDATSDSSQVGVIRGVLGPAQIVATGTITVISPKGDQALMVVTLPAGGSYQPNQIIANSTRGSKAWLKAQISGTTWVVSQPVIAMMVAYAGGGQISRRDDTWASGDTVTVYRHVRVNLVRVAPIASDIQPTLDDFFFVTALRIPDYSNTDYGSFQVYLAGANCDHNEVCIEKVVLYPTGIAPVSSYYANCSLIEGICGGEHQSPQGTTGPIIHGGLMGTAPGLLSISRLAGATLDIGVVVTQTFQGFLPPSIESGFIGDVFIDDGTTLAILGDTRVDGSAAGVHGGLAKVRGTGTIDVIEQGRLSYNGNPTAIFVNAGGLKINGQSTAYSLGSGASAQLRGGIALTPAKLNTSVGSGGFGGRALNPGGGSIVTTGAVDAADSPAPLISIPVALVNVSSTAKIASASRVYRVLVNVTSAYDQSATLSVGIVGTPGLLVSGLDVTSMNPFYFDILVTWPSDAAILVTMSGSPTTGAAEVLVYQSPVAT